jgi:hypothetical protein
MPRDAVLVNELDINEKGLLYLGMTRDELLSVLDEYDIYYDGWESDTGGYEYDFYLFEDNVSISFDEGEIAEYIQIWGYIPLEATSTTAGLNLGHSFDKMVDLYGDDYTALAPTDTQYQIYRYDFGDHCFDVWFRSDVIASWGIT